MSTNVNLWKDGEHALAYLQKRDSIPHRAEGYAAMLEVVPAGRARARSRHRRRERARAGTGRASRRGRRRPRLPGRDARSRARAVRGCRRGRDPAPRSRRLVAGRPRRVRSRRLQLRDPPPRARSPAGALRRDLRPASARGACSPTSSTWPPAPPPGTWSSSTRSATARKGTTRPTNWSPSRPIWPGWRALATPTRNAYGNGGNLPLLQGASPCDGERVTDEHVGVLRLPGSE